MMKNLFLCKTPYQIMVVTQLVLTEFKSACNDIIIADTIVNQMQLLKTVKSSGVFNVVSPHDTKAKYQNRKKSYFFANGFLNKLGIYRKNFTITTQYDRFFICNLGYDETILYREAKKISPLIECYMFEDGFASYTQMYKEFFDKMNEYKGIKHRLIHCYRKLIYQAFMEIKGIYAFTPALYDWKPAIPVIEISKIDSENKNILTKLNKIFGVDELMDTYEENFIFFEESYFADGEKIGDVELVQSICKNIDKSNFVVKIHPRNPVNRFKELGFKTNTNTSVPWEIIALNIDSENKILITIASGSALTSLVNTMTIPKRVIMLMNCKEIPDEKLTPSLHMLRKVANYYKDTVQLPSNYEELNQILLKLQKENER